MKFLRAKALGTVVETWTFPITQGAHYSVSPFYLTPVGGFKLGQCTGREYNKTSYLWEVENAKLKVFSARLPNTSALNLLVHTLTYLKPIPKHRYCHYDFQLLKIKSQWALPGQTEESHIKRTQTIKESHFDTSLCSQCFHGVIRKRFGSNTTSFPCLSPHRCRDISVYMWLNI